jgi:hypothetical protein
MKLVVYVLFEHDLGNKKEYQVTIDSAEVISFQVPEPIDLSDLNMKIQDNFHFVDAVIGELAVQFIDMPDRDYCIRKCLVIEAGDVKLNTNSKEFSSIFSDFYTDL